MTSPYNYDIILSNLEKKAQIAFNKDFKINDNDYAIWVNVLCYFLRDEVTAKKLDLNIQKGILINGPVGCGKTTIFRFLHSLRIPEISYKIISARELSFEYYSDGFQVIRKYSSQHFNANSKACTLVIDDIGSEQEIKLYGNTCNVIKEIILSRYDFFISHKMKTHFTTNYNGDELLDFYGERAKSRLREMCNLLSFSKATPDKRV